MTSAGGTTRNCVQCGKSIAFDANVCPYCGHDYRAVMAGPAAAPPHEKGPLSIIGGILILISGIVGLAIGGIFLAIDVNSLGDFGLSNIGDQVNNILKVCGAIFIILGILALIGGIFGAMRKHWGLAIVGGVMGLIACAPFAFAGYLAILPVLPLIGIILVGIAKKDFD